MNWPTCWISARARIRKPPYVACLYEQGTAKILAKIEEEAGELVEAAREGNNEHIIHEAADLWFHTLVLLCALGIRPDEVLSELGRRFGTSGHEEKAGRENNRPTSG